MFWVKNGLVHPLSRTARIRAQTSPLSTTAIYLWSWTQHDILTISQPRRRAD